MNYKSKYGKRKLNRIYDAVLQISMIGPVPVPVPVPELPPPLSHIHTL